MSVYTDVIAMLNDHVNVAVYSDFVPETEINPAIAVYNVSNARSRVLSGNAVANQYVFNIQVVAANTADVESIIETLTGLDNNVNEYFQRVFCELINIEPKEPNQNYRRAFVELRVY